MGMTYKIIDLPENERPREKLIRYGAETLSNNELLAIILRTVSKQEGIISLCDRIISKCGGLNGLLSASAEEFMELKGVGSAKATQL